MAKKTVKKVDVKKVAKTEVNSKIKALFEELGISIDNGVDYGMTEGTLVAHMEKCDVQIKLITPKAGVDRYEKLVEEEEEEVVETPSEEEKTVECANLEICKSKDVEICKECIHNALCQTNDESMDFLEV